MSPLEQRLTEALERLNEALNYVDTSRSLFTHLCILQEAEDGAEALLKDVRATYLSDTRKSVLAAGDAEPETELERKYVASLSEPGDVA